MELTCWGGAGTVTGSLHVLQTKNETILLDCGLFQGKDAKHKNEQPFPVSVDQIDGAILSHAHIDHCGRLPLLVKAGYTGTIYATPATAELCQIMLYDSAHIQQYSDKPLYDEHDVDRVSKLFDPIEYGKEFTVGTSTCSLLDAGHILGSASVSIADDQRSLLYSGDVGKENTPLLSDPAIPDPPDYLVLEATYGDKRHQHATDVDDKLKDLINYVHENSGNLIIPAFAVGRTQELIYALDRIYEQKDLPHLPVIIDSPLGIKATTAHRNHPQCYDERARSMLNRGDDPLRFTKLEYAQSADESKKLNERKEIIIIAGSGMADGGRVSHHLKRHLASRGSAVLFAGYQAKGTTGRDIVSGNKTVDIMGQSIEVAARIETLTGLSAHADRDQLISWVHEFSDNLKRIVLVHSEGKAAQALKRDLWSIADVTIANEGETIKLN